MVFRKYSVLFKLKCIEIVKIIGINKVSKITRIDKKCIRQWYLNRELLQNIKKKDTTYRLPGGGAKIKYPILEREITKFIYRCVDIGIKLNNNLIIQEMIRINPENKNKSKMSLKKWYYRLRKRQSITIFK